MSETTGYNGWSNYETWAVALWLGNEEGSYRYVTEQAEELVEQAEGDKDEAISDLAAVLKAEHEEAAPEVTGVFADLQNSALSEVDWYEIAEGYVDEAVTAYVAENEEPAS